MHNFVILQTFFEHSINYKYCYYYFFIYKLLFYFNLFMMIIHVILLFALHSNVFFSFFLGLHIFIFKFRTISNYWPILIAVRVKFHLLIIGSEYVNRNPDVFLKRHICWNKIFTSLNWCARLSYFVRIRNGSVY